MSALPTDCQTYIYVHKDAVGAVVYAGIGTKARAWACDKSHWASEHCAWIHEQLATGRIPSDWVEVWWKGLTKMEALSQEAHYIATIKPKFNTGMVQYAS